MSDEQNVQAEETPEVVETADGEGSLVEPENEIAVEEAFVDEVAPEGVAEETPVEEAVENAEEAA